MCGIAGIVGSYQPGLVRAMCEAQRHRGPDGTGEFEDPAAEVSLGHGRLSILDLTAAASQPMHSPDGRHALTFNGEIYNYRELRDELIAAGYAFRSTGDTEVLLYALIHWGEAALPRLNGMFAFGLWDRRERTLLLARDHVGVKPLYVVQPTPGSLAFASEIKALLVVPGVCREPNFHAIKEHMSRSHASGRHTAVKGVERLLPGELLRWSSADPRPRRSVYWQPKFSAPAKADYGDVVQRLREAVRSSVRRQMVSDVPIGSFLSGGLDSTLITALAARETGHPFRAYTISYPESENRVDRFAQDGAYAGRVAKSLGLDHVEIEIKPKVVELLPKLIWHLDEPLADPAVIACYLISELARSHGTTVLLSGQGADELFGGYPRYQAMHLMRSVDLLPDSVRAGVAGTARLLPGSMEGRTGAFLRRVRRVLAECNQSREARFMAYCSATSDPVIDSVLSDDARSVVGAHDTASVSYALMQNGGTVRAEDGYLRRDLLDYLPNHNLLYTDKMGMAVGLEARVPLLDLELLNLVPSLPFGWKVHGRTTKRILRDASKGIVSDEVIYRSKAGFGAPYRKWLRYDLADVWADVSNEANVRRRGWFDPRALAHIRELSQRGAQDLYMLQWSILTLELWAREVLDGAGSPVAV
jgi:asparagine synthase (glutamine-hydrolysing)